MQTKALLISTMLTWIKIHPLTLEIGRKEAEEEEEEGKGEEEGKSEDLLDLKQVLDRCHHLSH